MRRSASAFGSSSTPSSPSQSVSNRGHSAASKPSGARSPRDMTHEHMTKTPLSASSASSQLSSSTHSFRSPSRASKRRASVSESAIQSSTSGNRRSHPVRTTAARATTPISWTVRINPAPAGSSRRHRPSSRSRPCHRIPSSCGSRYGKCRCILEGNVISLNLYEEHESASFHNSTRKSGHILESRA